MNEQYKDDKLTVAEGDELVSRWKDEPVRPTQFVHNCLLELLEELRDRAKAREQEASS